MATGSEVARYWASLGVKVDTKDIRRVDAMFRQMEQRMAAFKKRWEQSVNISNFKFDSLKFQKSAQQAINKSQKLLQVELSNFKIDQSRLHTSLQSAINRAVYSTRFHLKPVVDRSGLSQQTRGFSRQAVQDRIGQMNGGTGLPIGALMGMGRLGIAGLGVGAGVAAVGAVNGQLDTVQDRVIKNDRNRLLLGQSVGGSEERRQSAVDWYKDKTQKYGLDAEGGIQTFNQAMLQLRDTGMTAQKSANTYDTFMQRFALQHMTADQQAGAIRQITQIVGKGNVTQEDLGALLENGDAGIKRLVAQAWAERTKYKGQNLMGDYIKAQSLGKVKAEDLLQAYAISAKKNADALNEATNSLAANAQRLRNDQFWNQFERDGEAISEATKDRIAAERELESAMKPLKDRFNEMEAAGMRLSASFITSASKLLEKFPGWFESAKSVPVPKSYSEAPTDGPIGGSASQAGGWLYNTAAYLNPSWAHDIAGSSLDRFKLQAPEQFKNYQAQAQQTAMQTMTNSVDNRTFRTGDTTFANGAIQVNVAQGDPETIVSGMETQLTALVQRVNSNTLSEASINYPRTGR